MPWPVIDNVPPPGDYLVTTTWREVLDAALRMGRDPTPWVAWSPQLAWAEIVARRSPLFAYLTRTSLRGGEGSGYAVEPNAVFLRGTERTAQAAFGYRLGMTMADWACRGLMGLGPTTHAESAPPSGVGPGWRMASSLPDLTGVHGFSGVAWLIEAKGGRKVGLAQLRKGAQQLCQSGLMVDPHLRVLSGASVEHRLTVTLDIEDWSPSAGSRSDGEGDDDYLLDDVRSRLLTYYALSALNPADRVVLNVGTAVSDRPAQPGLLTELEDEPSTMQARSRTGTEPVGLFDMLVGQVPNTDLYVGLSRRMYGACKALADAQRELLPRDDWLAVPQVRAEVWDLEENQIAALMRERSVEFFARAQQERKFLAAEVRRTFDRASDQSWEILLDQRTAPVDSLPPQFLESATADTYLALDSRSIQ